MHNDSSFQLTMSTCFAHYLEALVQKQRSSNQPLINQASRKIHPNENLLCQIRFETSCKTGNILGYLFNVKNESLGKIKRT